MRNPWTTKNPFMSAWLSGANKVMNTARGKATAATKQNVATAQAEMSKQIIDFWTGKKAPARPARKSRTR